MCDSEYTGCNSRHLRLLLDRHRRHVLAGYRVVLFQPFPLPLGGHFVHTTKICNPHPIRVPGRRSTVETESASHIENSGRSRAGRQREKFCGVEYVVCMAMSTDADELRLGDAVVGLDVACVLAVDSL